MSLLLTLNKIACWITYFYLFNTAYGFFSMILAILCFCKEQYLFKIVQVLCIWNISTLLKCLSFVFRIADWVLRMARYGFPRSPAQIKEAVKMILDKSKKKVQQFAENRPVKTFFCTFLRWHPQIKMSRVEKLDQSRAMACTKESIYAWFDEFEKFYEA